MKRSLFVLSLLVLCGGGVSPLAGGAADSPPVPDRIDSEKLTFAAWISADRMVTKTGELALDALPTGTAFRLDQALATAREKADGTPEPCLELGRYITDPRPGVVLPSTLADLADNSLAVLRGTVTARQGGFFAGQAGLLLQVRVEDRIKPSKEYWKDEFIYVYYPVGEFSIGRTRICKTDERWPAPPSVGDPLLLFPHSAPFDTQGATIFPDSAGYEVLVQLDDGVSVPPRLDADGGLLSAPSLDQVETLLGPFAEESTASSW